MPTTSTRDATLHLPPTAWVTGVAVLVVLVVVVLTHFAEARQFVEMTRHAEPLWLLAAVALQLATYLSAGAIWHVVARAAGHRLPLRLLGRLALEKLSVDQVLPTAGMAGNLVVVQALRRAGLPAARGTEALLVDLLAYYAAFAVGVALSMLVLAVHHDVTGGIVALVGAFLVLVTAVPVLVWWLLRHRDWTPSGWLARRKLVTHLRDVVAQVSPERVRNPAVLLRAGGLNLAVFLLDAATLWALMLAIGAPIHPLTAFVALVMATLAGTLSLLPGGLGTFEAGCTATLTLLGAPVEAALTGTLLLRGLTLWLPLVPGLLLARRDLAGAEAPE